MNVKKKAQIQQVFIYITAIIVVGIILLGGYKAINDMIKKGCEVEKVSFKGKINSYIEKYRNYGEYHIESLNAPCEAIEVCFVDVNKIGDASFSHTNPIIKSSVQDGIEQNIFLVSSKLTEPIGYSEMLNVTNGVVCIQSKNGQFKIGFEGLGRATSISEIDNNPQGRSQSANAVN